jgi:hypothetical protein
VGRGWRLTIRHGSNVTRQRHATAEEALEVLRRQAIKVLGEGTREETFAFRDISPAQQVVGRFEITAPSLIMIRRAGMDVKGDGSLVPYTGVVRKEPIPLEWGEDPYEALREALDKLR